MTLDEIKALKVPADPKGCVLYMWTTAPKVEEALGVMNAWGFSYRSQAIWDKKRIGMGYWFRVQHEILLVGVKGKMSPPTASQRVPSIFQIVRGQHSAKPEYVRQKIEEWYPNTNKLEMFARVSSPGWDVFGNEVEDSIEIAA
jgi:N6-adenosine-specific RNA methylase IME4